MKKNHSSEQDGNSRPKESFLHLEECLIDIGKRQFSLHLKQSSIFQKSTANLYIREKK